MQWVQQDWGGNEEKHREINQGRGRWFQDSEIENAEKHRHIPNVGRSMQMIM